MYFCLRCARVCVLQPAKQLQLRSSRPNLLGAVPIQPCNSNIPSSQKEPAWHRRARAQRSTARTLVRVAAATQLLARNHSAQQSPQPFHAAMVPQPRNGNSTCATQSVRCYAAQHTTAPAARAPCHSTQPSTKSGKASHQSAGSATASGGKD